MDLSGLFFYLFSAVVVASAFMVVAARNPVHAVLFLILAFVNAAGLFVLLGAEFLAMILVVVYVGAVAVLFLFVVMMLDVDFAELKQGFLQYLPIGGLIGVVFLIELFFVGATIVSGGKLVSAPLAVNAVAAAQKVSNVKAIGQVLYTTYAYYFQAAGLILLIAMIGAIVLTLHKREGAKRQSIAAQNARDKASAIEVRKVPFRQGV